jgi:hypothetical protein
LQLNQESNRGWFCEGKAPGAATAAFRLIHFAHKCDADKIDSFSIGVLFVPIGGSERIASKDQFGYDRILNVYITTLSNSITFSVGLIIMNSER